MISAENPLDQLDRLIRLIDAELRLYLPTYQDLLLKEGRKERQVAIVSEPLIKIIAFYEEGTEIVSPAIDPTEELRQPMRIRTA